MTDTNQASTHHAVTIKVPRKALFAAGGVALLGVGLAAGLMLRGPSHSGSESVADIPSAMQDASAPAAGTSAPQALADAGTPVTSGITPREPSPVPTRHHQREATHHNTSGAAEPRDPQVASVTPQVETRPAVVCANCGVIEAVRAVQQRGEGSGAGAVAGGLLGGVVGNQMGKGNGRTAMTVLGAIGGGIAGNEIEKSRRTTTVYEVRVRMDDGSVRTFTQATEPAPGTRVQVEGRTFHPVSAEADTRPATMQTSTQGSY